MSANITVMISGSGSNLKALLDAIDQNKIDGQVCAVIADRECSGQQHAVSRHIPFIRVDRKLDQASFTDTLLRMIPSETDLIVLAGFLSVVPTAVIEQWPGRIINLHPSLLPKFGGAGMYGLHVHKAVLDAGESISGCSVHYVDSGIDTGKVIAQSEVPVHTDDTPESLQKRIQKEEHPLLCKVVAELCHALPQKTQINKDFA
ncbi:phosphoribosylglycinamide formyltransferase [Cardiobacteriaceae bacterium TAE3-ERU3]|nr:phosphoribosylglycinamide formyltransferase [Cardiobacteriaceae bacterium TAE3-ERU3]